MLIFMGQYFLIVEDVYTKRLEVIPTKTITNNKENLRDIFAFIGMDSVTLFLLFLLVPRSG